MFLRVISNARVLIQVAIIISLVAFFGVPDAFAAGSSLSKTENDIVKAYTTYLTSGDSSQFSKFCTGKFKAASVKRTYKNYALLSSETSKIVDAKSATTYLNISGVYAGADADGFKVCKYNKTIQLKTDSNKKKQYVAAASNQVEIADSPVAFSEVAALQIEQPLKSFINRSFAADKAAALFTEYSAAVINENQPSESPSKTSAKTWYDAFTVKVNETYFQDNTYKNGSEDFDNLKVKVSDSRQANDEFKKMFPDKYVEGNTYYKVRVDFEIGAIGKNSQGKLKDIMFKPYAKSIIGEGDLMDAKAISEGFSGSLYSAFENGGAYYEKSSTDISKNIKYNGDVYVEQIKGAKAFLMMGSLYSHKMDGAVLFAVN